MTLLGHNNSGVANISLSYSLQILSSGFLGTFPSTLCAWTEFGRRFGLFASFSHMLNLWFLTAAGVLVMANLGELSNCECCVWVQTFETPWWITFECSCAIAAKENCKHSMLSNVDLPQKHFPQNHWGLDTGLLKAMQFLQQQNVMQQLEMWHSFLFLRSITQELKSPYPSWAASMASQATS